MKLTNVSSEVGYYRTHAIRNHINGNMTNVAKHRPQRSYSTQGFGNGFNFETREGSWDLKMGPDGKPSSYTENEVFDDQHLMSGFHRITDSKYQREQDGNELYVMRTWSKGQGLISDKTETVRVTPDGNSTYEVEDNSPVFSNTLRENRHALHSAGVVAGGLIAGVAGYLLGGPAVAACVAPMGAKFLGSMGEDFIRQNNDAPNSQLDVKCFRASDRLGDASSVGALLGAAGLAIMAFR